MSVTFTKESENLFVIGLNGVLIYSDLKDIENKFSAGIDRSLKTKLLVMAELFSGWGKEGDWGDLKFMYEHDAYIDKIAVVADEEWQDKISVFLCTGMRAAQVKLFGTDEEYKARDWLQDL
jgi:SpoIIAA-like